jgi:hypothetical protein
MNDHDKVYLGDGAYARCERDGIVITTENGTRVPTNSVFLEPSVARELKRFLTRCGVDE